MDVTGYMVDLRLPSPRLTHIVQSLQQAPALERADRRSTGDPRWQALPHVSK